MDACFARQTFVQNCTFFFSFFVIVKLFDFLLYALKTSSQAALQGRASKWPRFFARMQTCRLIARSISSEVRCLSTVAGFATILSLSSFWHLFSPVRIPSVYGICEAIPENGQGKGQTSRKGQSASFQKRSLKGPNWHEGPVSCFRPFLLTFSTF